jgi:hypothetical protein
MSTSRSRNGSGTVRVRIASPSDAKALLLYVGRVGATRSQRRHLTNLSERHRLDQPRRVRLRTLDAGDRRWLRTTFVATDWSTDPSTGDPELAHTLSEPIEELDLIVRTYNCLKREGIHNVGDLVARTEAELKDIRDLGARSIASIKHKLWNEYKLTIKGGVPPVQADAA